MAAATTLSHSASDLWGLAHCRGNALKPRKRQIEWPNITGNLTDVVGGASMSFNGGALTGDITDTPRVFGTTGNGHFASITLQAKRSSDAYGNSTTVQPAALRLLAIVKF